jgi:hypothetical protein
MKATLLVTTPEQMKADFAGAAGSSAPACWARPRTRGELRDRLARGETCEVVTSNATITSMMLRGWLQFNGFTVRPSENEGWSLFEPNGGLDRHPGGGT